MKLAARGQRWLKAIHLCSACLWVGSAASLLLLAAFLEADESGVLHGIDLAKKFVDDFLIVPAALSCLATGLAYALLTRWGFFRHWWLVFKWIVTVGGIIFGTFWLGPWLNSLPPISREMGMKAMDYPGYVEAARLNLVWGMVQLTTLVAAVLVSVFKPWGKTAGGEKP